VKVFENAFTARLVALENAIYLGGIMLAKSHIQVRYTAIELTLGSEDEVLLATLRVPICEAVGVGAKLIIFNAECGGELVAVAEIVEVVSSLVNKAATCFVSWIFAVV
jgi:hypothetical protein